jgi:hypothetical protein
MQSQTSIPIMPQHQLQGNILTMRVKKAPVAIRVVMFVFAFLFFSIPVLSLVFSVLIGKGPHVGLLIAAVVFGLLGFYPLRIALWNTYGFEEVLFRKNKLEYVANYGWFKDGRKEIEINESLDVRAWPVGYEDENKGVLIIENDQDEIHCVTKMEMYELQEIRKKLLENLA